MRGFCPRGARLRTPALYFNRCAAPAKLPIQPCPTICRPGQWAPNRQYLQAGVPCRHCRPQVPPDSMHPRPTYRRMAHECSSLKLVSVGAHCQKAPDEPASPPRGLVGKLFLLHSRSTAVVPEALTRARDRKAYRISGTRLRIRRGIARPPRERWRPNTLLMPQPSTSVPLISPGRKQCKLS